MHRCQYYTKQSRFNAISFKTSMMCFAEIERPIEKIHMESQGNLNNQTNLEKKTKLKDSHFLLSKLTTNLRASKQCGAATKTDIEVN